jgi:hypothetical protein
MTGLSDELEMRSIVGRIFLSLERIRKLAAGVLKREETQPLTVPRADMEDALALAQSVARIIKSWGQKVAPLRTLGWGGVVSDLLYGIAESGSDGVLRALTSRLNRPPAKDIEPIHIAVLISYDTRVTGNRELLLVLSGEVAWNNSPLSAISLAFKNDVNAFTAHAVDVLISLLPGIGPIYDISTGVLGYRLPDAQRLTNTERVLRIFFVGAGAILGLVIKGTRVTARTLLIMQAGSYAKVLNSSLGRIATFRALAVSVAKMTPENAKIILDLVKIVRKGELLSIEQLELFLSYFHAVNQTATAAHWAVLAKTPGNIVGNVGGVHVLKFVTLKKGEPETFAALTRNLPGAEIVSLPELSPIGYEKVTQGLTGFHPAGNPKLSQVPYTKHPDLAIEGALADIYAPERDTFEKIGDSILKKSSQAPTIVINLDFSQFTPQQVIEALPGIWANVIGFDLQRVILLNSKGFFKIIPRPFNFRFGQLFAIPLQTLQNLRETWAEIEKEDTAAAAK